MQRHGPALTVAFSIRLPPRTSRLHPLTLCAESTTHPSAASLGLLSKMRQEWVLALSAKRESLQNDIRQLEERCTALSASLADASEALKAAQALVDLTQAELTQTSERRSSVQQELANLSDFDPDIVGQLPVEILQAVFRALNQHPEFFQQDFGRSQYNLEHAIIPFRLSAVCHRWRGIATEMPDIWSCISLPQYTRSMKEQAGLAHLSRVRRLLKLSGIHPLDILLTCDAGDYQLKYVAWLQQVILAISQHAYRSTLR